MKNALFKKGDVVVHSSGIFAHEVQKVESLEWQEQRGYWRITDTRGSSYTESTCRLANIKDLRQALDQQRQTRDEALQRYHQLSGWLVEASQEEKGVKES